MTDDIAAIRAALAAVTPAGTPEAWDEWEAVCNPHRIARLLGALDQLAATLAAVHAGILRGEDDRELLAMCERAWKAPAAMAAKPEAPQAP